MSGTGALASEELSQGKVPRSINIVGPVWDGAKKRARTVDELAVSQVAEQLLTAYMDGDFDHDQGQLVPPQPAAARAQAVLAEAITDWLAGSRVGRDVDPQQLAGALATRLAQAGYAR